MKTTESGLQYIIHEEGSGRKPAPGDKVLVHYTGKLMNDTVFDTSLKRNQPFSFNIGKGQVIKGWDEGIALLSKGAKATLIIPPALGYGSRDLGTIPPNSTLKFEVELLDIIEKKVPKQFDVSGKDTLKTASGLNVIILEQGSGPKAEAGKQVKVHYSGYLKDGSMFDSSVERGEPLPLKLGAGMVIKGWDEGIALLNQGGKARLLIPPSLGYGERGFPPVIPANADLIFDVELVEVK